MAGKGEADKPGVVTIRAIIVMLEGFFELP